MKCRWYDASPSFVGRIFLDEIHNKIKVGQTFCHRNAVWEARDIIYWNAVHAGALQYTHEQMWAGGGLCLKSREQRGPNPLPKVWHSALPLASQVSSVGMGHAVYQGIGTTSPYSSLRLDSATSPTSSREHSTPSILRCIHPLSRV